MNPRTQLLLVSLCVSIAAATVPLRASQTTTIYDPDSRTLPAAQALVASATATLHLAANDLRDPDLIGTICRSASNGVSVTAVLNLSGGTGRAIAAARLVGAGVTVYSSTMNDVIANHLICSDSGTIAIGNHSWSPDAMQIGNWLSITDIPTVVATYEATFSGLVSGGTLVGGLSSSPTTVWFSPNGGAKEAVQEAILAAKTSIRVFSYTATNVGIFQALAAAHRRGVDVQIVQDRYCATLPNSQIPNTAAAGVPIFLDAHEKIMHDKCIVIDNSLMYAGSYNWSEPAERVNAEMLFLLRDPAVIAAVLANWDLHKSHSTPYAAAGLKARSAGGGANALPRRHHVRVRGGAACRRGLPRLRARWGRPYAAEAPPPAALFAPPRSASAPPPAPLPPSTVPLLYSSPRSRGQCPRCPP